MHYPILSWLRWQMGKGEKARRECQRKECTQTAVCVVAVVFYTPDGKTTLGRAIIDLPLCYEHVGVAILEDAVTLVGEESLQRLTTGMMQVQKFKPGEQLWIQVEKVEFTDPDYLKLQAISRAKKLAGG